MAIVAAIDDSERSQHVLNEADRLAKDLGEDLHALHVFERSELVDILEKQVEGQDLTENREVQQATQDIVSRGLSDVEQTEPTVAVRVGDPGTEIASYAAENDVRYVVLGGRQRSPTGKALFGSVTQAVIFNSPVPVVNVALE